MTEPVQHNKPSRDSAEARHAGESSPGHSRPAACLTWRAALALAWLALVLVIAAHQWQFWHTGHLNTDVLALLPADERAPEVTLAIRKLADSSSRQIVVLLGAPDWDTAKRAAGAWRQARDAAAPPLKAAAPADETMLASALAFYRPWRDRLLTEPQREQLQSHRANGVDTSQVDAALATLFQPSAGARMSDWSADPLNLWPQWWAERAAESRARPRDGELWLSAEGFEWIVMPHETNGPAFALDGNEALAPALRSAQSAAMATGPGVKVLAAGLPLHAEAAAVQASREINTIGWGSLAAVLLLVWLAFRSLRPILLVALSLLIGTAAALSVTAWVFGEVHLITLIFGASLVGVAEDYGIHYFASRQSEPRTAPHSLMRQLLPGMALALATSVLAYLVLGLAPFPGLRQMSLFSATGLAAAFLTVVCWFPYLDRGHVPRSHFADRIAASLARWPRWRLGYRTAAATSVGALLCIAGAMQLRVSDDIRQLQNSPAALVAAQIEIARLLGVPSVAQFFVVQGANAEEVLKREEALKPRLDALARGGRLGGYSAVSDWVPSASRQEENRRLTAQIEEQMVDAVNARLGEHLQRPALAAAPLSVDAWLHQPVSAAARKLWLGHLGSVTASVVMLRGLNGQSHLPMIAAAADGIEGVRWVDKAGDVSSLLGRYRTAMTWLLIAGHAAVLAALWWRYRRDAWRVWLPSAMASLICVGLLGWLGQPFQLFNVLALLLLLGIGVDYGIFLQEHRGDGSAWLAVVLGATSTWLAFGLLGLSGTPALRAFGLTLLFGVALVWYISPCLRAAGPAQEEVS